MKSTVIRVLRDGNGSCVECLVESDFVNAMTAENYAENLNRMYATNDLRWIVDTYKA